MPNTPALLQYASTAIAKDKNVDDETFENVKKIFSSIGFVEEISEDKMNEIIPVNGSMPAYLYYFVEAFLEEAVNEGLDYEVSKKLACEAIIGSCKMIMESGKPTDELIKDVCSPGGATLAGLKVLEDEEFKKKRIDLKPQIEIAAHELLIRFASIHLGVSCVVKEFSNAFAHKNIIVTSEVGQHQIALIRNYEFTSPLITSGGLGAMGFGFSAAIGASIALGGKEVVAFVGDGSFQMNSQELAVCKQYDLPVKVFIMNNSSLGLVRQTQEELFEGRAFESSLFAFLLF